MAEKIEQVDKNDLSLSLMKGNLKITDVVTLSYRQYGNSVKKNEIHTLL